MQWKILDTGEAPAKKNMAIDADLLQQICMHPQPILHFYEWRGNSATFGYFARPENLLNFEAVSQLQLNLARRPTGGGVLFHFTDLAFSIVVPASHPLYSHNTLENYARINQIVKLSIHELMGNSFQLLTEEASINTSSIHFCMGKPTIYDVMMGPCKIAGAAQRRTKHGLLHQGSIHLALPDWDIISRLVKDCKVVESMRAHSVGLVEPQNLDEARRQIKDCLTQLCRQK